MGYDTTFSDIFVVNFTLAHPCNKCYTDSILYRIFNLIFKSYQRFSCSLRPFIPIVHYIERNGCLIWPGGFL